MQEVCTASICSSFYSSMPDSILHRVSSLPARIYRPAPRKISIRWSKYRDEAHVDVDNMISLRAPIEQQHRGNERVGEIN